MAVDFSEYIGILTSSPIQQILLAILAIVIGIIVAKVVSRLALKLVRNFFTNRRAAKSFSKMLELLVFVIAIIIALNYLEVDAAKVIIFSLVDLMPKIIIVLLLLALGYIIINLIIDLLKAVLLKAGFQEYMHEAGVSFMVTNTIFSIIKILLFVIILSAALNYAGIVVPFVETLLIGVIFGIIVLLIAIAFFVFKEPLENFFAGVYLEKNVVKPGMNIRLGNEMGEIIGVTHHGTLIKLATGYNILLPNKELMKQKIYIRRSRQDISKLEAVRERFIAQLPSYCGPASAAMMLSFFGYQVSQEELGKIAGTKQPGGTGPGKLIESVKTATKNSVDGVLIRYDSIYNLKEEVKTWLSEGALILLWFNKPALFMEWKGRGHFVLCVGIEGDEFLIMDPSGQTAGVYMIDYRLFEEAMSEHDKKRGYIVFAKRGTSAHWRMSEGLIYSDITAYEELSKSFERYLKKLIRRSETINQLISEFVARNMETQQKKPKVLWKPDLKRKNAEEKPKKSD